MANCLRTSLPGKLIGTQHYWQKLQIKWPNARRCFYRRFCCLGNCYYPLPPQPGPLALLRLQCPQRCLERRYSSFWPYVNYPFQTRRNSQLNITGFTRIPFFIYKKRPRLRKVFKSFTLAKAKV